MPAASRSLFIKAYTRSAITRSAGDAADVADDGLLGAERLDTHDEKNKVIAAAVVRVNNLFIVNHHYPLILNVSITFRLFDFIVSIN